MLKITEGQSWGLEPSFGRLGDDFMHLSFSKENSKETAAPSPAPPHRLHRHQGGGEREPGQGSPHNSALGGKESPQAVGKLARGGGVGSRGN